MAKIGTSQSVDLLMVLDEKDNIRKWANEVKAEFQLLKKPLTVHICRIQDLQTEGDAIKCKKVALFTDKSTHSLQKRVRDWIEKLGKADKTDDYLIINIQAENDTVEAVAGIKQERVVNICDFRKVSLWWPELLQLCLSRKVPEKKLFWGKNFLSDNSGSSKPFENFKDVEYTDTIENAHSICLVAENGKQIVNDELKGKLRDAKIRKIPVHFYMHSGEEVSEDIKWITSYIHAPSRPLRAIFWIANDLGLVNVIFADRPEPKKVPTPCGPCKFLADRSDWIYLMWSIDEPDDASEEAVKHFTIEVRNIYGFKRSEWVFVRQVAYDGSGTTEIKINGLNPSLRYQFRISAENVNGRSKSLTTEHMIPSSYHYQPHSNTDVYRCKCCGCFG